MLVGCYLIFDTLRISRNSKLKNIPSSNQKENSYYPMKKYYNQKKVIKLHSLDIQRVDGYVVHI